jgi:hypothetical protein
VYSLPATLQPIHQADLGASLITERIFNLKAIIYGKVEATKDIFASIRAQEEAQTDNAAFVRCFSRSTADLAAEISARNPILNISGFIRVGVSDTADLLSQTTAVSPFININKVVLSLVPIMNLEASLIQHGGLRPLRAIATPKHSVSTTTSDDAHFITTATDYRFYLGTTAGLFIPPRIVSEVRVTSYYNSAALPDLHATISGFHASDFGASLCPYPQLDLPATLNAWTLDHLGNIRASLACTRPTDFPASIVVSGGYEDLSTSLEVDGVVSDLGATLIPYINTLALNVVSVSTVPIADIGAIINYDTVVPCATKSSLSELGAFLRPLSASTPDGQDLGASINVLSMVSDLPSEMTARKRTRIRLLGLNFRSRIRASASVRASITPVVPTTIGMSASISGLLHEKDLPTSIIPVRYAPFDADFTATERVVDLSTGSVRDVLISFRSQVSAYVYEEITNNVYATDRGTWAIDLRTTIEEDSFFDRSLDNREVVLDALHEYYSLDEAIRHALVILCERRQQNIGATLNVRGAISDLGVRIGIVAADRMGNMSSSLVAVANSPDVGASINPGPGSSALRALSATVTPSVPEVVDNIGGSITGSIIENLMASITAS